MFFSWDLNVPTKDVKFFDSLNHFDAELIFHLEHECLDKECMVLSSLKSFQYKTVSFFS